MGLLDFYFLVTYKQYKRVKNLNFKIKSKKCTKWFYWTFTFQLVINDIKGPKCYDRKVLNSI